MAEAGNNHSDINHIFLWCWWLVVQTRASLRRCLSHTHPHTFYIIANRHCTEDSIVLASTFYYIYILLVCAQKTHLLAMHRHTEKKNRQTKQGAHNHITLQHIFNRCVQEAWRRRRTAFRRLLEWKLTIFVVTYDDVDLVYDVSRNNVHLPWVTSRLDRWNIISMYDARVRVSSVRMPWMRTIACERRDSSIQ